MGVTYYRLEQRYEGDVTKGCGLTSAQVDENFHFLRGYGIKDATFKDGILTLERVNCDKIVIEGIPEYVKAIAKDTMDKYDEPFKLDGTEYNPETGVLTIYVNGNPYEVAGFEDTNFDFKVYVGYGLDGQGTIADPIRISHINDTGFFAPVERVIDYEQGEKLPDTAEGGDVAKRYITREAVSPYGMLYTYEGVKNIDRFLANEGQGWRVPTFEDWVMMLNGQEDCKGEYVNHGNPNESSKNGRIAGQKLKSIIWDEETAGEGNFDVLPMAYRRGVPTASFWSSSVFAADTHIYGEEFVKGEDTVTTLGSAHDALEVRALRLVRDSEWGNESDIAVINGIPYKTVQMPTYKVVNGVPVHGTAVWTKENVTFDDLVAGEGQTEPPYGDSMYLPDESAYAETVKWNYYLNYYDSFDKKWIKKRLNLNDIVMVHDFGESSDVEVIVKLGNNGDPELRLRSQELFDDIKDYVDSAITEEKIEREKADRELWEAVGALAEELSGETVERIEADDALQEQIGKLNERVNEVEREAADGLAEEKAERIAADDAINERIDNVESALTGEMQERKENDIAWGTNEEVLLGLGTEGLAIKSHYGEKKITRTFNLNMGTINIKEMI